MKKILLVALFVALMSTIFTVGFFSISANAAAEDSGITGECTWQIDDTTLIISGRGAMCDYNDNRRAPWRNEYITAVVINEGVTSIGNDAFSFCFHLTNITIPDSVKSIGESAFFCCKNLKSITVPNTVTVIKKWTFYCCNSLENVVLPNSITSIGEDAFYECKNLVTIAIPSNVKSIGESAFYGCKNITSISIPKGVVNIEKDTFSYCESLTKVTIPNGVKNIKEEAFFYCIKLASLTIPDSVTSIGERAFARCDSLKTVTIGKGVKSIGEDAFDGCIKLCAVYITDLAAWCKIDFLPYSSYYVATSNPLCYAEKLYINGKLATDIVIPNNVTVVGTNAFYDCKSIKSVTFGSNIKNIKSGAFGGCKNIKTVYYCGTEKQWNNINFGHENTYLKNSTIKYHKYTNTCDTSCNVCKTSRKITHTYKTTTNKATFTKNGSIITKCSVCGKTKSTLAIKSVKSITLSKTSYTYNSKVQKPSVTVKDSSGKTLKKNTDYTVTYASGCKNAGTYKVTVKMKGKYSGSKTLYFKIKPLDISKASVKFSKSKYYYAKKSVKATVATANGVKIPSSSVKYTYKNNIKVGTATVTVKASGNFTGTKKLIYKICPKPSSTSIEMAIGAKKSFSVSSSSKVKYTIGNSDIIKYSNGKIVSLKAGTTTIKATSNGVTTSVTVAVMKPRMNKTTVSTNSGHTFSLKMEYGSGKFTWSSSNSKIAKVSSSGKVTPLKVGTCYIYAKQNGKTYKCKVSVSQYYKGTKIPDFGAIKGILPFDTISDSSGYMEKYVGVTANDISNYYSKLSKAGFAYWDYTYSGGVKYYMMHRGTTWLMVSTLYDDNCFNIYINKK